jgi:N-acetylmuramoyl-L-alanine amidase
MSKIRVYLSPSLQEHNVGVLNYGNEMERMHQIAAYASQFLKLFGFSVKIAPRSLAKLNEPQDYYAAIKASNDWKADVHVCLHSNTVPGTIGFYHNGDDDDRKLAQCLARRIAPISPGKDALAVRPDTSIYASGFAELRLTLAPACLIELFSHTNPAEVKHAISHRATYGLAIAWGVCDYFGVSPKMPKVKVS